MSCSRCPLRFAVFSTRYSTVDLDRKARDINPKSPEPPSLVRPTHTVIDTLSKRRFFHLHLISDATGETLISVARAASAQYAAIGAVEHVHSQVRSRAQAEAIVRKIEEEPGIVLYTLIDRSVAEVLEAECLKLGVPTVSVLEPVLNVFQSYLGAQSTGRVGAQHALDADYFRRIDALNFTLAHDDGALPENIDDADVIIVGVSRTSKTPTSIYLANRGIKTANLPLVPGVDPPARLVEARKPLVIGLIASPDRVVQVRQHRVLALQAEERLESYTDRVAVAEEIAASRKLCARNGWPVINVTRRSIEETASAILGLLAQRREGRL